MASTIIFAAVGAIASVTLASGTYLAYGKDGADVDSLSLLQMRAGKVARQSHELSSTPLSLADVGQAGDAVGVAAAARTHAASKALTQEKTQVKTETLESELADFISAVHSAEFITHEAVQHIGEDCWEPCSQKGGLCAWCGAGNSCCRSGWARNPAECIGVTSYKTKKHECVGPAPDTKSVALVAGNSSANSTVMAISSANATLISSANVTVASSANSTASASDGISVNTTSAASSSANMSAVSRANSTDMASTLSSVISSSDATPVLNVSGTSDANSTALSSSFVEANGTNGISGTQELEQNASSSASLTSAEQ